MSNSRNEQIAEFGMLKNALLTDLKNEISRDNSIPALLQESIEKKFAIQK